MLGVHFAIQDDFDDSSARLWAALVGSFTIGVHIFFSHVRAAHVHSIIHSSCTVFRLWLETAIEKKLLPSFRFTRDRLRSRRILAVSTQQPAYPADASTPPCCLSGLEGSVPEKRRTNTLASRSVYVVVRSDPGLRGIRMIYICPQVYQELCHAGEAEYRRLCQRDRALNY
jgi:hypothetical protein